MRPAILEGWLFVPYEAIVGGVAGINQLKEDLTYRPRYAEPGDEAVRLFKDDPAAEMIGVPRAFGLRRLDWLEIEDRTVLGGVLNAPRLPDPNHPSVRDPARQAAFMALLERQLAEQKTFLARAPTGSGKTVCALWAAGRLARQTIVCVHLERLLDQWRTEIMDKLGLRADQIGLVQKGKCSWQDKPIVLGMIPSLARRAYAPALYKAFGLVIFDEVHKVGAPLFSRVAPLFHSRYRFGMSATVDRPDGGERVFFWHLGAIRATSEAEALPMKVYVRRYKGNKEALWGSSGPARVKCLSLDGKRNRMIAGVIQRMYTAGRQGLIVSSSVRHLQTLMSICRDQYQIPQEVMGQFTGEVHYLDAEGKWAARKQHRSVLDSVKADSQLIFATYGMMKEGIDIPRLDAGIDATPQGKATQLIGRVRRPRPGKKEPIWVTILDEHCGKSKGWFRSRRKDYAASGAEVIDHEKK